MTASRDLLGPVGPFAEKIDGFAPRPQQQALAGEIEACLESGSTLVAEAGTGVGKTYAYLVPAMLSGGRTIISTHTKTLQDQLFHRDIPLVTRVLDLSVSAALLKGRSNYVCLHRLERARAGRATEHSREIESIAAWSRNTESGDITELEWISEDSQVWPLVTSTAENCLGAECPLYSDCFVVHARRAAQQADLVVVNHHLFFADMALKQEGFADLLPGADAFILDEAHQIPEIASAFFGLSVSSRQIREVARDARAEAAEVSGALKSVLEPAERVENSLRVLQLAFGGRPGRGAWRQVRERVATAVVDAIEQLDQLRECLGGIAEGSKGLESCTRRCESLVERLRFLMADVHDSHVVWYEAFKTGFVLHATPLDIAEPFRLFLENQPGAWVFTSATLAVGEQFDHFTRQLGLHDAVTCYLTSPFDYQRQSLLYVPPGLPEPGTEEHTRAVVDAAEPVLAASGGGAFLLFTSHRALRQAAELLEDRIDFPLFVQGRSPRAQLLQRFREAGNGVLLGTASFWGGVDVKGQALSCVIIDKLPFASPGDPVLEARLDTLRRGGMNPFATYQLPMAVLSLKQGAGRLIRDVHDFGVLVVCDVRLLTRSYGRVFMDSLPDMPFTQELDDVKRFYRINTHVRGGQS